MPILLGTVVDLAKRAERDHVLAVTLKHNLRGRTHKIDPSLLDLLGLRPHTDIP